MREEDGAEAGLEQRQLGIGIVGSKYAKGEEAVTEDVHVFPVDYRLNLLDRTLQNGDGLA